MAGKKLAAGLLSLLAALILIILILLTTIEHKSFDLDFFQKQYQKLDNAEEIGMSELALMDTTVALLAYIKGDREDLNIRAVINGRERQVFNEREIEHMVDVQMLYLTGHQLRNIGIVLLLCLLIGVRLLTGKKFFQYWAGGYLIGSGVLISLLVVLAIIISRDFLWFWDNFHHLIFTNDLWMLNPETDILIQMVPEAFFFSLVTIILVSFTLMTVLLGMIAGFIMWKRKEEGFDL